MPPSHLLQPRWMTIRANIPWFKMCQIHIFARQHYFPFVVSFSNILYFSKFGRSQNLQENHPKNNQSNKTKNRHQFITPIYPNHKRTLSSLSNQIMHKMASHLDTLREAHYAPDRFGETLEQWEAEVKWHSVKAVLMASMKSPSATTSPLKLCPGIG